MMMCVLQVGSNGIEVLSVCRSNSDAGCFYKLLLVMF